MTVQALFVDPSGIYPKLLGMENCWDEARDARCYEGSDPVVAHPPCHLWVNLAAVNYTRATVTCSECDGDGGYKGGRCERCGGTGRREPNRKIVLPAWYPEGSDSGMFESALSSVRCWGGVLEHPAESHAWERFGLAKPDPEFRGWTASEHGRLSSSWREFSTEVWQSAYGHAARKRTWLLYCGGPLPFALDWRREPGTHQIGWFDRKKPTLGKRAASATPKAFAGELIRLAEWSRGWVTTDMKKR